MTAPTLPLRTLAALVNAAAWVANEALEWVGSRVDERWQAARDAMDERVCERSNLIGGDE